MHLGTVCDFYTISCTIKFWIINESREKNISNIPFFLLMKGQLMNKLCAKYEINWPGSLYIYHAQIWVGCPYHLAI